MKMPPFRAYSKLVSVLGTAVLQLFFGLALAEQREISMLAPWTAEGKVYKVGPAERQFVGVFKGIMYADNREGEMNTALFACPAVHLLDTASSKTEASGRCHIVATEGNIYGRFSCTGEPGWCDGRFEITAGSDEFEGITGSGDMNIRMAISTMMRDATSGDIIAEAEGLAVWPNLVVNMPETER